MKRRAFMTLLGGAAVSWPLAVRAQQTPEVPRIGFVYAGSKAAAALRIEAILSGLRVSGYAAPAQVEIVARTAEGDPAQIAPLVAEVIAKNVNVFIVNGPAVLHAAHLATRTIPIVALDLETDPVASGVAASLARPGGNVTGFTLVESSIVGKWLELLKEIAPRVKRVAFLFQPATAPYAQYYLDVFKAAAPSLGIAAIPAPINKTSEIEPVIAEQARDQNGGLILMPDTFLLVHRAEITSLAARYALPALYPYSNYTKAGGLVSYGYDLLDNYRRAAIYADRILRGTKPSELPVQLPVKVQLTVNLTTAKALGLNVPSSFLLRADEVIE